MMVLQMHVAAGELDERFVKDVALAARSEPDVLQDIMRLEILLFVEEAEVFEITRVESVRGRLCSHTRCNALVFSHHGQAVPIAV